VPGSTPRRFANSFLGQTQQYPRWTSCAPNRSTMGSGLQPRSRMIVGMYAMSGWDLFDSQL
jgi:hypothetical protein